MPRSKSDVEYFVWAASKTRLFANSAFRFLHSLILFIPICFLPVQSRFQGPPQSCSTYCSLVAWLIDVFSCSASCLENVPWARKNQPSEDDSH